MCVRALFQRRFLCGEVCGEKRKWGEGVRNSGRRNSVTVFFFRNRFRHACRSLPGGGGRGRRREEGYLAGSHVCFDIRNSKIY